MFPVEMNNLDASKYSKLPIVALMISVVHCLIKCAK